MAPAFEGAGVVIIAIAILVFFVAMYSLNLGNTLRWKYI